MPHSEDPLDRQNWRTAWKIPAFRKLIFGGFAVLAVLAIVFPIFFQTVDKRNGIALNDWILNWLPAIDVSIPIFIVIWFVTALMLIRSTKSPAIFISFLWGYALICVSRMITITLVPLNPPLRLLELTDRLGNTFYGNKFVTKDLFYSGHTASLFLMYLCFKRRNDKLLALFATLVVGVLLLIQHVHYTIDVAAAPIFVYCMYLLGRRITNQTS